MIPRMLAFFAVVGMLLCPAKYAYALELTDWLSANGEIDVQYDYVNLDDNRSVVVRYDDDRATGDQFFLGPAPSARLRSGVAVRRARLGLTAAPAGGFRAEIRVASDLDNTGTRYGVRRNYVDRYYASLDVQGPWGGVVKLGYDKVFFGVEATTEPLLLKTVERSVVNQYFNSATEWDDASGRPPGYVCTPLGVGDRHLGLFWRGRASGVASGLGYTAAITNAAYNPFGAPSRDKRRVLNNYYAGVDYRADINESVLSGGLNVSYLPQGVAYFPIERQRFARLWAFNPWVRYESDKFYGLVEGFAGRAEHGQFITGGFVDAGAEDRAAVAKRADSYGLTVIAAQQVWEDMEIVGRVSFLDTGGAGFSSGFISDAVYRATPGLETSNYDTAMSFYIGGVYRITPDHVRLTAGYEFVRLEEDLSFRELINNDNTMVTDAQARQLLKGARADIHTARVRVQFYF